MIGVGHVFDWLRDNTAGVSFSAQEESSNKSTPMASENNGRVISLENEIRILQVRVVYVTK